MRVRQCLGAGIAIALTASMLAVTSLTAAAVTPPAPAAATPPVVSPADAAATTAKPAATTETYTRPDLTSAYLAARLLKHRIEVTGLETETTTTWTNPDGTLTTDSNAAPIREQVSGAWANVDTTLVPADGGGFKPKVSAVPVVFSGGGAQPLVSASADSGSVATKWAGALPVPMISGNTATYTDVSPGVNLVVTAGVTGYEESIVLTSRPTAATRFRLPIAATGLSVAQDPTSGALHFTGRGGKAALVSNAPMMWGAALDPHSDQPIKTSTVSSVLSTDASGPSLTVSPSAAFLADPSVTYPVTIDPPSSLTDAAYTYISSLSGQQGSSFFNNSRTEDGVTGVTHVGTYDFGADSNKAFYQFVTTPIAGATVVSASLNLNEVGSYSCTPEEVDIFDSSNFTSANTWNSPPAIYSEWAATTAAKGYTGCAAGPVSFTGVSGGNTITQLAQAWATHAADGTPNHQKASVAVVVPAAHANDNNYWKIFAGNSATLSLTYTGTPSVPAGRSTSPCGPYACGAAGSMVWTNNTTPTLGGESVDPNGSNVQLNYEIWAGTSPTPTTRVTYGSTGYVPSGYLGQASSWTPSAGLLTNGSTYEWRADATNGTTTGGWSSWVQFTVDTTPPAAPSVSTSFPSLGTGTSGTFSWSDTSTDLVDYNYYLDAPEDNWAPTSVTTSSASGVGSGSHAFVVIAEDAAGNQTYGYASFAIGNGYLTSPLNQARTQRFVTLSSVAPSGYPYTWYQYRVGSTASFAAITLPGSGTSSVTNGGTNVYSWPVSTGSSLTWDMTASIPSDGLVQVEACYGTTATSWSICTGIDSVQLSTHAFSQSDATKQVGPGTVALLTGDYAVNATDVKVPTYQGSLTVGRTFTTLKPMTATGAAGVFGPGWVGAFYGPNAGHADAAFSENSVNGYVTLTDSDGTQEIYNYNGTNYVGVADTAADGSSITKNSSTQYTLTEADGAQTVYTETGTIWSTTSVTEASGTTAATTTNYTVDGSGRVTQIEAPAPAGVTCTSSPTSTAGCRTLQFSYAGTTTATGTTWTTLGDYSGQLKSVFYWAYDPNASDPVCASETSNMCEVLVASYQYDSTGHLREEWDPRISPNLVTTYTYDPTSGQLVTLTPPGLATTTLTYDGSGRISTVQHPDPSGATATSTMAYAPTVLDSGPASLTSSAVAAWGQTDAPVTWAAIFDPDHVPASSPTGGDWPYADLTYMDVNGRTVNTASYGNGGWLVSADQYDASGNDIWSATPGNLAQAITPTSATDPAVRAMTSEVQRANALASTSTYSADGTELISSLGPTHPIVTSTAGTIDGRASVTNTYDESAPGGGLYRLLTTSVSGAQDLSGNSYDNVTVHRGYDALVSGDTTGWTLHKPTSVTTVMPGGGSANLVTSTRYNSVGQVIESRLPMGGVDGSGVGNDAYTTDTSYYTATGTGGCVSAALTGLPCSTGPAAQPTSGKALPVTTATYNLYDQPLVVTETFGSVTRTTTTTYDGAGRTTAAAVTVSPSGSDGTATPSQTFGYDSSTGLPTTTTANSKVVTTGYDSLGRVISYTDATGAVTTTTYDLDGRVASVTDPNASSTYVYDGSTGEHRGLVTSSVDSLAGTFSGTYDNDGHLLTQTYPGGLTATYGYDNTGALVQTLYSESGVTWLDFTATRDAQARIAASNNAAGTTTNYVYDNAGRLTSATDNTSSACNVRAYGFNNDSDRTSLATSTYSPTAGACTGSGTPTTVTHSYDQADRLTDTGYSYDDFGRTTGVPSVDAGGNGALTLGYYTNDLVQQVAGTVAGAAATTTYGLDPQQRVLTQTTQGSTTSAPAAPSGVTATAGSLSATVSWSAASNGGSPITGYTVTSSPGSFTATVTGATTATVTGLTNGTAYTFTVTATNAIGTSGASVPSTSVTPVYSGILYNSAEGGTAGTTVTASNSGGASINAFNVVGRGAGAALVYATGAADHGTLGYSLSGTSGTTTEMGWGGFNATSMAVRFYYNPGTILPSTTLRLLDIRNSTGTAARLYMSSANQLFVQNTAGTTIKTFPTVLSANTWYRIEMTISISATAATINAAYYLADGSTPVDTAYSTSTGNTGTAPIAYVFYGDTSGAAWTGTEYLDDLAAQPGTTSYIGAGPTAPGAPTGITAAAANTAANVTWTAPTTLGGSPITGYTVTSSPGSFTATTAGATTATVTGLTNGTSYTFTVTATNAVGTGSASSASGSVTPAVGNLANSAEGGTNGTTVTVANSGGASGDPFSVVTRGTGAALTFATAAAEHGSLGYSLTATSGTTTAVTWNGYNATSAAVRFYYNPGSTLPSTTVRLLDVRNSTGTAARVLMTSSNQLIVQNAAGTTLKTFPTTLSANTWYRIELGVSISATAATVNAAYYPGDSTTPVDTAYSTSSANTGTANITTISIGDTTSGTWAGTAYFDDLAAQPATTSYIGPVPTAPGAPTSVTGIPGNGNVTLSWTAPTSTGGSPITSYTVTASPGGASTTTVGSITTATVPSLTNGTAYTFTVTATNAVGTSAASSASASLTPAVGNTLTNYYDNSSDSPAWSGGSDGTWTRNVTGLDGNTDASVAYDPVTGLTTTTMQLMDLHGNVAATANPTGTGLSATYTYDEFGNATTTNGLRYGWLGGKDRAQAGVGNLTLMGQRLYDPATGRFLQTDPVPGGSANAYDYCNGDGINCYDLNGTCPWWNVVCQAKQAADKAWAATRFTANWANGSTKAGLLYAQYYGGHCSPAKGGMILCVSLTGGVAGHAFTVGNVIMTEDTQLRFKGELAHETKHADQWAMLGPINFAVAYIANFELSKAVSGNQCLNIFEREAGFRGGNYRECLPRPS
jgi:RHS repeat-associated protein